MQKTPLAVALAAICLSICLSVPACSPSFTAYSNGMFQGKRLLGLGEYGQARDDFLRAAQAQPDAYSYAFAASASYKLNDLVSARQYIERAERLDGGAYADLRIRAYKALILIGEGKQQEGLNALRDYIDVYSRAYPLGTIRDVEAMWRTGRVSLLLLERILDEQILTYENDIEEFHTTGTGWYGQRYQPFSVLP